MKCIHYVRRDYVPNINNCNEGCVFCAVPPRWVVEPTDASVERNKHVTLHCQAQGVPQPAITWKKATGMGAMKQR
jgi:hypothetical protein